MRTAQELLELIDKTNVACGLEFGLDFTYEEFQKALENVLNSRKQAFISKRVGHIPDVDFVNLIGILKEGSEPKIAKDAPAIEGMIPVEQPKRRGRPPKVKADG